MDKHAILGCPVPQALWKRSDLQRLLQISSPTLSKLVATGELPAPILIGKRCRWRVSEIMNYVQSQRLA